MTAKEPKYPIDFKEEVCRYAKKENIKSAAAVYGINPDTAGRWFRKYKASGVEGLKICRTSSLKSKLDPVRIEAILKELKKNPKLKLREIREKFCPDCSLTLISNKLKKHKDSLPYSKKKKRDIYLSLRMIRHVKFKKKISTLYQLTLHNCEGKILFTGFTKTKYSSDICYFIRLGLSYLKKKNRSGVRIVTSLHFLNRNHFSSLVAEDFNATLTKIRKKAVKYNCMCITDKKLQNAEDAIFETYRNLINKYNSSGDLKNLLLTPVIDIDLHQKKHETKLGAFTLPAETRQTITKVINDIKKDGDAAVTDFDYDKAFKEYDKAYMAAGETGACSVGMQVEILLKKAKLLYDTEKYQPALMLLRDCVAVSKRNGFSIEQSDSLYYLGLIYNIYHNRTGALRYMKLSAEAVKHIEGDKAKCFYYRALFKKALFGREFKNSEKFLSSYLHYANLIKDRMIIGRALHEKATHSYVTGNYTESAALYEESIRYNRENNNNFDLCQSIIGLLGISVYYQKKALCEIEELIYELTANSKKMRIPFIDCEAQFRAGLYYYNNRNYRLASQYFEQSIYGNKQYSYQLIYLSNLYYIGRNFYAAKDYIRAVRAMKKLSQEALFVSNFKYNLYAQRIISKIYYERNDLKRAAPQLKKVAGLAVRNNELYIAGESLKLLGEINFKKKRVAASRKFYERSLQILKKFQEKRKTDISGEIKEVENLLNNFS